MSQWIRVGDLLVADDATAANLVNSSSSLTRAALDALYDSTDFASQAEALSGAHADKSMSPLRTRQAFNQWFPGSFQEQADARRAQIARIELVSGEGPVAVGNTAFLRLLGSNSGFTKVDPIGIVGAFGTGIVIERAGWYRFSATMAIGGTSDSTANFAFGWNVSPNLRENSQFWLGVENAVGEGGVSRSNSTITRQFGVGDIVTPAYNIRAANVRNIGPTNRSQNRVTIEYLGAL